MNIAITCQHEVGFCNGSCLIKTESDRVNATAKLVSEILSLKDRQLEKKIKRLVLDNKKLREENKNLKAMIAELT